MREIKLTQGKVALVDDEDFERLNQFKWHSIKQPNGRWYAERHLMVLNGKKVKLKMHREILGLSERWELCDHINGNGLDNRRVNLRRCTQTENLRNQGLGSRNTSGFRGVRKCRATGKWVCRILTKHIGQFESIEDAARAYNTASKHLFGDFARLNNVTPLFLDIELFTNKKSSKFMGVVSKNGLWQSQIYFQRKTVYVGCFNSEEKAAMAYDEAAKKYYGEFAKLNFPDQ